VLIANRRNQVEPFATTPQRPRHHRQVCIQMPIPGAAGNPKAILFHPLDCEKPDRTAWQHWKFRRNPFLHIRQGILAETQQSHQWRADTVQQSDQGGAVGKYLDEKLFQIVLGIDAFDTNIVCGSGQFSDFFDTIQIIHGITWYCFFRAKLIKSGYPHCMMECH
jgi:hypothetical protein